MCKYGNNTDVLVMIPASLSHTGKRRWAKKPIDSCIADLVGALQHAGIVTTGSCCGHGDTAGYLDLEDGRSLIVLSREMALRYAAREDRWKLFEEIAREAKALKS